MARGPIRRAGRIRSNRPRIADVPARQCKRLAPDRAPAGGGPTPPGLYSARGYKPEDLASATARLFLGVRIECAQCHDHPFATWKRDRFWEFAANFAGITRQGLPNALNARVVERKGRAELQIPGTGRMAQAGFLDGTWAAQQRAGALRRGSPRPTTPTSPRPSSTGPGRSSSGSGSSTRSTTSPIPTRRAIRESLDDLSRRFAESGFNLPLLFRALAASRAYQLTSEGPPERSDEPRTFARMAVRGMSGEQWYDSLAQAIGRPPEPSNPNPRVVNPTAPRAVFLEKFASTDERTIDRPTSILQALAMMHGPLVAEATDPKRRGDPGGGLVGPVPRHPGADRGPLPRRAHPAAPPR